MTALEPTDPHPADDYTSLPSAGIEGDPHAEDPVQEEIEETLLERMGGWQSLVYSTLPVLIFVPINAWKGLQPAIWVALAVALVVFCVRLFRKEKLTPAVSGFFTVALCAFIAYRMGNAKGYFVWGIWVSAAYAILSIISMIARWPIVGVLWNALNGLGQAWRADKNRRRWYDLATLAWALVFAARFVVQQWLYAEDAATALGVTRIVMGWPLTILAVVVSVWAIRKTTVAESAPVVETVTSEEDSTHSSPAE